MRRYLLPLLFLFLVGCRSYRPAVTASHTTTDTTTIIIRDRLVPVHMPEDSATLEALLRCDENGRVLMTDLMMESSRRLDLSLRVDSLNRLLARAATRPDTVYVAAHDTIILEAKKETEYKELETVIEIPRRISAVELYLIVSAVIAHAALLFFIGYKIRR